MVQKRSKLVQNVGRRIAEFRLKRGLTQDQLAERANVTGGYIRQVEGGSQNLTLESLEKFTNLLKCRPGDLLRPAKTRKRRPGRPRPAKP